MENMDFGCGNGQDLTIWSFMLWACLMRWDLSNLFVFIHGVLASVILLVNYR